MASDLGTSAGAAVPTTPTPTPAATPKRGRSESPSRPAPAAQYHLPQLDPINFYPNRITINNAKDVKNILVEYGNKISEVGGNMNTVIDATR